MNNKKKRIVRRPQNDPNYLRLPFGERRKVSLVDWVYKHRVGVLTTLIIHLVIIILFLTYQIIIHPVPVSSSSIEIPDEELEKLLEPEKPEEQVEVIENAENIAKAKNKISDLNAELDASIPDHRNKNVQKIYDEAAEVQKSLAAGAEAYRKGMAEVAEMENAKPQKDTKAEEEKKETEHKSVKQQGNVTVSYDLAGRYDVYLYIPAYKCEGSGVVVVTIAVDRNGNVTHAAVSATTAPGDDCINDMALYAARESKFNASQTSPDPQKGTIKYQFEKQ